MSSARTTVALIIMRWMCDSDGDWPELNSQKLLAAIDEPHSGDCTKQPWTCCRCEAERAYTQTDQILAAIDLASPPTP